MTIDPAIAAIRCSRCGQRLIAGACIACRARARAATAAAASPATPQARHSRGEPRPQSPRVPAPTDNAADWLAWRVAAGLSISRELAVAVWGVEGRAAFDSAAWSDRLPAWLARFADD